MVKMAHPDWKRRLVERELQWRRQKPLAELIAEKRASGMTESALAVWLGDRLSNEQFHIDITRQNIIKWCGAVNNPAVNEPPATEADGERVPPAPAGPET